MAAERQSLNKFRKLGKKYNFGIISVDQKVEITQDIEEIHQPFRIEFEQNLELMNLNLDQKDFQILSLTRNQLLNYLVVLVTSEQTISKEEFRYLLENEDFSAKNSYKELLRGAVILGFLTNEDLKYTLTNRGRMGKLLLKSYNMNTIQEFDKGKEKLGKGKHKPIIEIFPEIGEFFRLNYLQSEDFRTFLKYIPTERSTMGEILEGIFQKNPSFIVIFMTKTRKKDEALNFIKNLEEITRIEVIHYARNFLRTGLYFTIKKHLISMGFIEDSTLHNFRQSDYDPYDDFWKRIQ